MPVGRIPRIRVAGNEIKHKNQGRVSKLDILINNFVLFIIIY